MIIFEVKNKKVRIAPNDSEITKDIISHLPIVSKATRYIDREYYVPLDFTPQGEGIEIPDFSNGDVTYFPKLNTFAVFFDREGQSTCPGLMRIGRVVSGSHDLIPMEEEVEVKIYVE